MTYDEARGSEVMESVIFFEMSLSLGKIAAALLAVGIFSLPALAPYAWTATFVAAVAFTGLYALLKENGGIAK
jgi:hypothetical protein